jgi:hypothetical protein
MAWAVVNRANAEDLTPPATACELIERELGLNVMKNFRP